LLDKVSGFEQADSAKRDTAETANKEFARFMLCLLCSLR
jgi:hypothetical protein